MKIRNIPFGYSYLDGKKVIETNESNIVKEIFNKYLIGESLNDIAESLNNRQIEYMTGVIAWNKGRLRHLLEDKRYIGENGYPYIIDEGTFKKANQLKYIKNTQKNTDRKSNIFNLNVPIICTDCGNLMHRFCTSRLKFRERWVCTNAKCKTLVIKSDTELLSDITDVINRLINNADALIGNASVGMEQLTDMCEIYIRKEFYNIEPIDRNKLKERLFNNASAKYNKINFNEFQSEYLKDIIDKYKYDGGFPKELFEKIVTELKLYKDGTLGIVLINNQEIKEA